MCSHGYNNGTANTLRLWKAQASDLPCTTSTAVTTTAVQTQNEAENISMVLYPNDQSENGKELRAQYAASASLQDICAAGRQSMARILANLPIKMYSNLTTPTQRWPWPNSCAY